MQKEDIEPNVMSWGALIGGYAQQGEGLLALECFKKMEQEGIQPNDVIFLSALKACATIEQVDQGKLIHDKILKGGFQSNVVLGSTLIDMYAKCGSLEEAYKVFDNLQGRDIVSWNAMITGYAQCGEGFLALEYFHEMLKERIEPSQVTFLGILKACAILRATECGRLIHDRIIKSKLQSDVVVGSTLVDMYAKCGSLQEACSVFHKLPNRNVVSWGAMIAGYSQWEEGFLALDTFQKMQLEGIRANDVVFLGTLQACACIGNIEQARFMHHEVIVSGLQSDIVVGNTLVDMYAKCGSLEEAQSAFKNLPYRDVVSWGAIIAGYAQHGECFVALQWFERMQEDGILPDEVTFLSLLKACAIVGAIEKGKFIHDEIIKRGLHFEVVVGNTLVDMYAKCGSLEEACKVFNKLQDRDLVSWNAMVSGYSHYGKGLLALECFENMLKEGIVPNDVSFHVILVTCSYSGLVDEGHWYFNLMRKYQGLRPGISHCTSMIDLLGRAGCLYEAEYFLHSTKQADVTCWTSLLSACKLHQNLELGQHCFDRMISLDTDCSAGYVLISNIYADVHMHWETCDVEILGSWESESLKAAL